MEKLRGVNLGGWLVLERWMTPSLFEGTAAQDEYTFMETQAGPDKLVGHHQTFITEEDFAWLGAHGINAVRIPVGYWILDGDAPYKPCISRLDWALKMAEKYDIKVLISMHGAPGSQNGHDHSGRICRPEWHKSGVCQQQTIDILARLVQRYNDQPAFWGIELLNEPKIGLLQLNLRRFYRRAYQRLTEIARPGLTIVFHDAFTPRLMDGALMPRPSHPVMMDIHWYHFAFWLHKYVPMKWYYRLVRWHGKLIQELRRQQGIIIGEWSMVISSEALRRYPERVHQHMMDEHADLQLEMYDAADGWFYWTYKTEGRGLWNFRSLVEDGRIVL